MWFLNLVVIKKCEMFSEISVPICVLLKIRLSMVLVTSAGMIESLSFQSEKPSPLALCAR